MTDADYQDFQKKLKDFPHSFQLENYRQISREKYNVILNRLKTERDSVTHARRIMEEVRDHNFISFINFILNDNELAFDENELARNKEPSNIVALANYVHMLYMEGNVEQTDALLLNLEHMKKNEDFKVHLTSAKAELAYSYNRMGPNYNEKSVHFYMDVIRDEDYSETPNMLVWKFGAALAIRRCFKFGRKCEYTSKVKEYLEDIIERASDQTLVAKSWIEMAENHILDKMNLDSKQQMINYLKKALGLCKNDAFVLERCGKFYRYLGDLDQSREYLEEAIAIRPTTFSYEHLALTYQAIAKETQKSLEDAASSCFSQNQYEQYSLDSGFQSDMPVSLPGCSPAGAEQLYEQTKQSPIFPPNEQMVHFETGGRCQLSRTHSLMETPRQLTASTASQLNQDTPCDVKPIEFCGSASLGEQLNLPVLTTKVQRSQLNPNAMPFYPQGHLYNNTVLHRSQSMVEAPMVSEQLAGGYANTTRSLNDVPGHIRQKYTYIKSPIVCLRLPCDDPNVEKAMHFFKESLKISGQFNQSALFELGLLYRSIGDYNKAIEYFKKILSSRNGYKEPQQQINSYEQIGLCYRDMANETDKEEKLKLSKIMLTKAIEICAKQTAGRYKTVASLPTLRALLSEDEQTGKLVNLQELARLHKMVGKYRESLEFFHKMFKNDKSLASNPNTAVSVLENFLQCKDYQNAAVFLDILMCTEDGKALATEKELISRLYTESTLYYMKNQDFLSSRGCFQSQFLHRYGRLAFDKDGVWDVVVLDDPDVTSSQAECLMKLLHNVCGLETTRNTDDALGGVFELQAQADIIDRSKTVLILLGKKEMTRSFKFNTTIAAEMLRMGKTASVVLVTLDKSFVPDYLSALPCKEYLNMQCCQMLDEQDRVWLLDLFQKLIEAM